uniref:Homeobox domain-containing protein n=1 Tax=Mola mola TaxID=94237 RepID=A0A3Q3W355_MOLML
MVRYFSVDWLAQSHHSTTQTEEQEPTCRPHVPCMVQPRPPAFGQSFLQPKPKASRPVEHAEQQESGLSSPLHPASCASPISEMSGYSSGYESEAASSEGPSEGPSEGAEVEKDGPQRRVRTKFSAEQIAKLEKIFNKHKYLDGGERVKTAQKLGLTETQVRTWFQNRRMKLKREVQDCLAPQVPPVMFQHLPPVQFHHSVASQRPFYPAAGPAYYRLPIPQLVLRQPPPLPPQGPSLPSLHFY